MTAPATYLECLEEEESLLLEGWSARDALTLGLAVLRVAPTLASKPIAVHIQNAEHPLFTHFMDGMTAVNWDWVGKKSRVVHRFGHSSWGVGIDYKERGLVFQTETGLDPELYRAEGGSVPILVRGSGCVASLTISGLQGFEDHAIAVAGLRNWFATRALK